MENPDTPATDTSVSPDGSTDNRDAWPSDDFATSPGVHRTTIQWQGHQRDLIVYVSSHIEDESDLPLLLVLHGGGGTNDRMRNVGFEAMADRDGGVIVYPQGYQSRWADGRSANSSEQAGINDVGFLDHVIAQLRTRLPIDPDRIGVTGASNGGMMSHRMACQSTQRLGMAAAVIASLPSELMDVCEPGDPPSMLGIQGTEDPFVTFEGGDVAHDDFPNLGEGGPIESAESTMSFWSEKLGCQSRTSEELPRENEADPTWVEQYTFADCSRPMEYYVVHEMGHSWPPFPAAAPRVSGPRSTQLSATEKIWRFLRLP